MLDVGTSKAHRLVLAEQLRTGPHRGAGREAAEGALQRAAVDAKRERALVVVEADLDDRADRPLFQIVRLALRVEEDLL